jgi:hypothetical protein
MRHMKPVGRDERSTMNAALWTAQVLWGVFCSSSSESASFLAASG